MKISLYRLLPLSLMILTSAHADEAANRKRATEATVKIYSGLCGKEEDRIRGSGTLISHAGKHYVITSDHVLLAGNRPYCHRIANPKIGSRSATLVASDWGVGLALLAVDSSGLPVEGVPFEAIRSRPAVANEGAPLLGYPFEPFDAHQPTPAMRGYVHNPASARHFFAHKIPMIELMDSHGEFGMSGGGAFSADFSSFIGVLSHQALMLTTGGETQVMDMSVSAKGLVYNHVFAIPSAFVRAWIANAIQPEFRPSAVQLPQRQSKGIQSVVTDGLEFVMTSDFESGISGRKGGGDGVGISDRKGGGDGVGISDRKGGGDGVGISDLKDAPVKPKVMNDTVTVLLAPMGAPQSSLGQPHLAEWLKTLKDHLYLQKQVKITFLLKRANSSTGVDMPERIRIRNLARMFRDLADPTIRPLTRVTSAEKKEEGEEAGIPNSRARQSRSEAAEIVKKLQVGAVDDEEETLLKNLAVVFEALGTANWDTISPKELRQFTAEKGPYEDAWKQLFTREWQSAVDLMQKVDATRAEIETLLK